MTDISQMIRWKTGFVRGLAQSVLERAKAIRSTLAPYAAVVETMSKVSKPKRRASGKRPATPRVTKARAKSGKSGAKTGAGAGVRKVKGAHA
jgi:hypothetical protein